MVSAVGLTSVAAEGGCGVVRSCRWARSSGCAELCSWGCRRRASLLGALVGLPPSCHRQATAKLLPPDYHQAFPWDIPHQATAKLPPSGYHQVLSANLFSSFAFLRACYSPASRKIFLVTKFHTMTMAVAPIFTMR